jgi:hypothetical protein
MRQVACNATFEGIGQLNGGRYVLHDRDAKFCAEFRETLAVAGVKESTKIRGVCNIRSSESMGTLARPKRAVAKTPMFLKSSKRVQPSSGLYNQQVKCPPPGF